MCKYCKKKAKRELHWKCLKCRDGCWCYNPPKKKEVREMARVKESYHIFDTNDGEHHDYNDKAKAESRLNEMVNDDGVNIDHIIVVRGIELQTSTSGIEIKD